jgi:hypothetical protein
MSDVYGLVLAIGVSVAISTVVFAVMRRPLQAILAQLCAGATGTQFWLAFTGVMLYIAPLLVTLLGFDPGARYDALDVLRRAAIGSLTAAMIAMLVMGVRVSRAPVPAPAAPAPTNPNEFWGERASG